MNKLAKIVYKMSKVVQFSPVALLFFFFTNATIMPSLYKSTGENEFQKFMKSLKLFLRLRVKFCVTLNVKP